MLSIAYMFVIFFYFICFSDDNIDLIENMKDRNKKKIEYETTNSTDTKMYNISMSCIKKLQNSFYIEILDKKFLFNYLNFEEKDRSLFNIYWEFLNGDYNETISLIKLNSKKFDLKNTIINRIENHINFLDSFTADNFFSNSKNEIEFKKATYYEFGKERVESVRILSNGEIHFSIFIDTDESATIFKADLSKKEVEELFNFVIKSKIFELYNPLKRNVNDIDYGQITRGNMNSPVYIVKSLLNDKKKQVVTFGFDKYLHYYPDPKLEKIGTDELIKVQLSKKLRNIEFLFHYIYSKMYWKIYKRKFPGLIKPIYGSMRIFYDTMSKFFYKYYYPGGEKIWYKKYNRKKPIRFNKESNCSKTYLLVDDYLVAISDDKGKLLYRISFDKKKYRNIIIVVNSIIFYNKKENIYQISIYNPLNGNNTNEINASVNFQKYSILKGDTLKKFNYDRILQLIKNVNDYRRVF